MRVWHGSSAGLADALGTWLHAPGGADPFTAETISVPTPGIERWLTQQLAQRFGICARVEFPRLDRLTAEVLAQSAGVDPDADPWAPDALVWPVLTQLEEVASRPDCALLARHIAAEHTRRFVVASRAAHRFHRYAMRRPGLLAAWSRGDDIDAAGRPLDAVNRWQAHLWRAVVERLDAPDPVTRLASIAERLRRDPALVTLPRRLAVFGPTTLTAAHLAVLDALGATRAVTVWLPHPSPRLWSQMDQEDVGGPQLPHRGADPTTLLPHHPLLQRLARESRELHLVVRRTGWPSAAVPDPAPTTTPTLLQRLQQAVRDNATPPPAPVAADDTSVRFHRCHGPDRQVEVLRETLLGLLADDPALEPRDIIVQCPAIDEVATLLHAAFTPPPEGPTHPGQRLPVRLADRSLREVNPVLQVVATVLELVAGRATRSDLLDLCGRAPVARRFGWEREEDLARITDLIDAAVVNWGIDAGHREQFRVPGGQGTWASAADRLVLSLLRSDDDAHVVGTAVPVAVDIGSPDLVGHLAEFIDRVAQIVRTASTTHTPPAWIEVTHRIINELTDTRPADRWQVGHAHGVLADLADAMTGAAGGTLRAADVLAMLSDALRGRPTRTNFGTGAITICTLMPMRTVPHKVVVLLGMDDTVFPRHQLVDGDDLLLADARVGDPDPAAADRQAFLDAALSATERLVVIHRGFDERDNQPIAAAPPVQDLLDACVALGADPAAVTRRHPLQPHGEDDFRDPPVSFDRQSLEAAESARTPTPAPAHAPFEVTRLPPLAGADEQVEVSLTSLTRFFADPATHLLRERAGLATWRAEEPPEDLPLELDGLQQWEVNDRMLRATLAGVDPAAARDVERRRGAVPPSALGTGALDQASDKAEEVAPRIQRFRVGPARTVPGAVEIGRFRLTGAVGNIHQNRIVCAGVSRVNGKRRLQAWIELLALTAFSPGPWEAVVVGNNAAECLGPVAESTARATLNDLLTRWWRGMHTPWLWDPNLAEALLEPDDRSNDTRVATVRGRAFAGSVGLQTFVRSEFQVPTTRAEREQARAVFAPLNAARRRA